MKILILLLSLMLISFSAEAKDGSWFGMGANYEHLSSGASYDGYSVSAEGGYWYLGNVAYGGYFKAGVFNDGGDLKIYDLGAFWKAGTEQGLYGKLLAGIAFIGSSPSGFKAGDTKSFYLGLGGGFLFPVTDTFQIGPEVIYRHLTAGNGGDQISVGALVTYGF